MATIYRFVIEQKQAKGSGTGRSGSPRAEKGAAKKGKDLPLLWGGEKGGVEHNRKMRAINPILNKITSGVWEKSMRLGRAAGGLIKQNTETGKLSISGPSIAIIIALILITAWNIVAKFNQRDRATAERVNTENYKHLENGGSAVHGAYSLMVNQWSGRINYNENK